MPLQLHTSSGTRTSGRSERAVATVRTGDRVAETVGSARPAIIRSLSSAGISALQQTNDKAPGRKVSILAWAVSIAVHLAIATGFIVVSLSGTGTTEQVRQTPQATLAQELEPLRMQPLVTDLQVEPLLQGETVLDEPEMAAPAEPTVLNPAGSDSIAVLADSTGPISLEPGRLGGAGLYQTRFCGSGGSAASVCYVVDCSGSMVIAFDYVRRELHRAISNLSPAQYFHVIFYAGGVPIQPEPYRLIRANKQNRQATMAFVDQTDLIDVASTSAAAEAVVAGLKEAFEVKTADGRAVDLIYLLTDGEFNHYKVKQAVRTFQGQRKQAVQINVIACGNRDNENFLRGLAGANRGRYRFVSDEELANAAVGKP